jgi:nucleoside 2-deoxyribosyltransferase
MMQWVRRDVRVQKMDNPKYQIFISSTFLDLKQERQAAVEAVLQAGHIPAGMELFAAEDRSQLEAIKAWIDDSDIYGLILGTRYGSIEPESKFSYTEYEYRYAISKGKPTFALVLDNAASDQKFRDLGAAAVDAPEKLAAFRSFVQTRMVKFVNNTDQIKLAVMGSIQTLQRNNLFTGFRRAPNTESIAAELARLSSENARLVAENEKLRKEKTQQGSNETDPEMWIRTLKKKLVPAETEGEDDRPLLDVLLEHSDMFALGIYDEKEWLFEIGSHLLALGLAEYETRGIAGPRIRLSSKGISVVAAIEHYLAAESAAKLP